MSDNTINIAEPTFRMISVLRNTGIFRTLGKSKAFCMIWSNFATAKKKGCCCFDTVKQALFGNAGTFPFLNGIPKARSLHLKSKLIQMLTDCSTTCLLVLPFVVTFGWQYKEVALVYINRFYCTLNYACLLGMRSFISITIR